MTTTLKTVGSALEVAYGTLDGIAASKGHRIKSVTVDVANTNLRTGKVAGTVTVENRSRRKFTLNVEGSDVVVNMLGVTKKIAA